MLMGNNQQHKKVREWPMEERGRNKHKDDAQ